MNQTICLVGLHKITEIVNAIYIVSVHPAPVHPYYINYMLDTNSLLMKESIDNTQTLKHIPLTIKKHYIINCMLDLIYIL